MKKTFGTPLPQEEKQPYIPELGLTYPDKPDAHMYPRQGGGKELVLDEHYPFLDRSFSFRFKSRLLYLGIFTLVFPLNIIRFALRIEGRRILGKNRKLLCRGALSVSNHVLRWDLLMVLQALRFRRLWFPAFKDNLTGPDREIIRLSGGIPVPDRIHVMKFFNQAFDELHGRKKWFHVFPEAANWHYYQPIRPFKKGMFTMAFNYKLPVIPMAFSWRPARGLYRVFNCITGKNYPLVTLRIGEPVLPDLSRPRREAVALLRREVHRRIVELAGIRDNPFPPEGD
jgi:1-acyl-sn-glycerol-3-phosphate acyltransferase